MLLILPQWFCGCLLLFLSVYFESQFFVCHIFMIVLFFYLKVTYRYHGTPENINTHFIRTKTSMNTTFIFTSKEFNGFVCNYIIKL